MMFGIVTKDAAKFGVHVEGAKELIAALDQMDKRARDKIVKAAARRVLKPVLAKTREIVPVDRGDLKASLALSVRSRKGVISAGVRTTKRVRRRKGQERLIDGFYGMFVEHGHKIAVGGILKKRKRAGVAWGWRWRKVKSQYGEQRGEVAPRPFIRPAWDAIGDERINADFQAEVQGELQRIWDAGAQPRGTSGR